MESYTTKVRRIDDLKTDRESAKKDFERNDRDFIKAISALQSDMNYLGSGLDLDKIRLALTVLHIRGSYKRGGRDRDKVVAGAINDLAIRACKHLKTEYYGTKNYAEWSGQGSNHPYGYGPKHGSICFAVELVSDARARDLTEAEIEAAVYYLNHLKTIEEDADRARALEEEQSS